MYLTLFVTFLVITLILIALALYRPEHSELGLIGFLFLFLLSFVIINGTIEVKTGVNYTYDCLCCGEYYDNNRSEMVFGAHPCDDPNNTTLVVTSINDVYESYSTGGDFAHWVGYYLAVASIIGFIAILVGIKGGWRNPNE